MRQAVQSLPAGELTVGSMFAGVGGVCEGFRQAGFRIKWANEFDRHACITYRANHPDTALIEGDITKIDPASLPPVDLITSGFPCQAFSVASRQLGFLDRRGLLFFSTAEAIRALRPKAYFLENVKNLLTHDKGDTFRVIRQTLTEELGYSCIPFVLDSARFGNIPQHRERIYAVGFRGESEGGPLTSGFRIPAPVPLTSTIHDCLSPVRQPEKYYLPADHPYMPLFLATKQPRDTVYQLRRTYVRENKSNLCPTLTANMGGGGNNVPFVFDDWGVRRLTPGECYRFQGFPESYAFPEGMADIHLYKQCGNSVTVPVVRRIAEELKRVLSFDAIARHR